jgi:hypothetical protein
MSMPRATISAKEPAKNENRKMPEIIRGRVDEDEGGTVDKFHELPLTVTDL